MGDLACIKCGKKPEPNELRITDIQKDVVLDSVRLRVAFNCSCGRGEAIEYFIMEED